MRAAAAQSDSPSTPRQAAEDIQDTRRRLEALLDTATSPGATLDDVAAGLGALREGVSKLQADVAGGFRDMRSGPPVGVELRRVKEELSRLQEELGRFRRQTLGALAIALGVAVCCGLLAFLFALRQLR